MREIGANGREALIAGKDPDMSVKPAVSVDIDDLDAAQSELAMMRRRLRAAAHEIRTPLAGAATIIDILAASDAADGPMRDYVFLLKDAVAHIVAVTNDIFTAEEKHYVTLWMRGEAAAGEASVRDAAEVAEVGWFAPDALPAPLFLSLENLLAGHCLPANPRNVPIR